MKTEIMSSLDMAKSYLERGWSVIPIRPRDKRPLESWKEFQTRFASDEELVDWFEGTNNNVGIVTGAISNLTIVDCDSQEALNFFEQESAARGESIETYTVKTPRGWHYYFLFVPGSNNFQSKKEWPGIDLRSEGGYVVAPPSIHPSGNPYKGIADVPMGIAPSWLFEQSVRPEKTDGFVDENLFAPCPEGGRNMALTRIAGWLLQDMTSQKAIRICRWWNQTNPFPLPDEEIIRTVESVAKKEAQKSEEWSEPLPLEGQLLPEFPSGLFPDWFEAMIQAVSQATETPPELAAGLGLASLASACQRTFEIEPEPGYVEPLNIWINAAMDPGNRKTAVHSAMTEPLSSYEKEQAFVMGPQRKEAESQRKTAEARIHHLRLQAAKSDSVTFDTLSKEIAEIEASLPKVPVVPQIWVEDITPEKLAHVMAEQGGALSLISDEGGIFETFAGRYNGGIPNLDLILKSHSGSAVRIHRACREPIDMDRPTLTMGLSPQPEILRGLVKKPGFRGCGLLARFIYVIPVSCLGFRTLESKSIPLSLKEKYGASIHNLLRIEPPKEEDGTPGRFRLKLTPEAHGEWKEFSRIVEHDMRDGERFEYMRDWAGKLPGAAARVAGLLHCAKHAEGQPRNKPVDRSTMEQALTLMAILAEHAIQAFEVMAMNPDVEKGKKILAWIQREGAASFTLRECHRELHGSFRLVEDLKPGLAVLIERSFIRLAPVQRKKYGRPSVVYEVNPQALEEKD